jgi:hypothetical protein
MAAAGVARQLFIRLLSVIGDALVVGGKRQLAQKISAGIDSNC